MAAEHKLISVMADEERMVYQDDNSEGRPGSITVELCDVVLNKKNAERLYALIPESRREDIDSVLGFRSYIAIEPNGMGFEKGSIMSAAIYEMRNKTYSMDFQDRAYCLTGAAGLKRYLGDRVRRTETPSDELFIDVVTFPEAVVINGKIYAEDTEENRRRVKAVEQSEYLAKLQSLGAPESLIIAARSSLKEAVDRLCSA